MRGAAYLGRELPLGILRGPQVLDQLLIFNCALKRHRAVSFSQDTQKGPTVPAD